MRIADSHFDRVQARNGLTAKNQSQMGKIIPMLQIGSKKGLDEEQTIQKQADRVTALATLLAGFEEATRRLWTLQKVERDRKLKRLTNALDFMNTAKAAKLPHGTTKAARACINELTSLLECAYLDELTDNLIDLSSTKEFHVIVSDLLRKAVADKERGPIEEEVNRDPVFAADVADVIRETASQSVLPSLTDKGFVICRVPVIPVAKGILSVELLRARGFNVTSLAGYPAINNQLVLGINPRELELTDKEKAEGVSIPRSRWFEVADKVRKAIRKDTKQKIEFVDERPYGYAGGAWFWLMLEQDMSAFASAFPGQSVQLRNWGFAHQGS